MRPWSSMSKSAGPDSRASSRPQTARRSRSCPSSAQHSRTKPYRTATSPRTRGRRAGEGRRHGGVLSVAGPHLSAEMRASGPTQQSANPARSTTTMSSKNSAQQGPHGRPGARACKRRAAKGYALEATDHSYFPGQSRRACRGRRARKSLGRHRTPAGMLRAPPGRPETLGRQAGPDPYVLPFDPADHVLPQPRAEIF